nr:penicillin-binding protein activator [Cellvibrionaceae bacterium]
MALPFLPITLKHLPQRFTWLLPLSLLLILSACGTTKSTTPAPSSTITSVETISADIAAAERLSSPAKDIRFITHAEQFYTIGERQLASALIARINTEVLSDADYINYIVIANTVYTEQQLFIDNYHLLSSDRIEALWNQLPPTQQHQLGQRKARLYSLFGLSEQSLLTLLKVDDMLSDPLDIVENRELIWQQLMTFPLEELTDKSTQSDDAILRGWYQLAQFSKLFISNIQAQSTALAKWQAENPSHPANEELPLDLQLLQTLLEERPQKIALLLPLQGDFAIAGKAIRDGFFAAYFNNQDILHTVQIDLFDTGEGAITELYDRAVNEGAHLIIGPLRKENVRELNAHRLSVTTLALNYLDNHHDEATNPENPLFQFGLSLEDEAKQAAERAWLEGHRYAMILSSQASWSQRSADAFSQQWRSLGGTVIANHYFSTDSNYSNTIKNALNIDKSQARAQQLKRLFGQS